MTAIKLLPARVRIGRPLGGDMLLGAALIGLDVVGRLAPHAPNFTPVAASALFAATVLHARALSLAVPIAGMLLSDAVLGFDDWRMTAVIYGALALPACAASLSSHLRRRSMAAPVLLSSSLIFFLVTNLAVWAWTPLYAPNFGGLVACYAAALPFLRYTIAGDLFWGAALFGAMWVWQAARASQSRPRNASAA